jgi:hypothetical protein
MTDAGNTAENNGATPPPPPPPAPGAAAPAGKSAWYENVAIVILSLFCCWPIGLIFVWLNKSWTTKTKTIITAVIIGLTVAGGIVAAVSGGSSSSNASSSVTTAATQTTKAEGSKPTTAPASATTCKDTPNTESFDSKKQGLYPTRAGVTKTDHEAAVGDCVRVSGATTYVTAFKVVDSPGYNDGQLIVITMSETNRDLKPKSYTYYDWNIQTPKGILLDPDSSWGIYDPEETALDSAEMVTGTTVEGTVGFKYDGPGTYYVIFDGTFQNDRGVWAITVP